MVETAASSILNPLPKSDGSATYSIHGVSIIGGVNGPVEVQRRDEIAEEAAINVTVRPAAGVGGVRERHLESVIERTLQHVILVTAHPRTLIQVTLQIIATLQEDSFGILPQAASGMPMLPALLQTSMLALLSTSIQLSMTLTSTLVVVGQFNKLITDPSVRDVQEASSIHALAFSSKGDLILNESEGKFDIDVWEQVCRKAEEVCLGSGNENDGEDVIMDIRDQPSLQDTLENVLLEKTTKDLQWMGSR